MNKYWQTSSHRLTTDPTCVTYSLHSQVTRKEVLANLVAPTRRSSHRCHVRKRPCRRDDPVQHRVKLHAARKISEGVHAVVGVALRYDVRIGMITLEAFEDVEVEVLG